MSGHHVMMNRFQKYILNIMDMTSTATGHALILFLMANENFDPKER